MVVAIIASVIGVVGVVSLKSVRAYIVTIGEEQMPSVQNVQVIAENLEKLKVAQRTLLNGNISTADRARQYENITKVRDTYTQAIDEYEKLPHSSDEQQLWTQFKRALDDWKKENNTLFDLMQQLEKTDILDPAGLTAQIKGYINDHYVLKDKVLDLIKNNHDFSGGDDHTQCNFGKWVTQFKTENSVIDSTIKEMLEPHRDLHEMVKQIKDLVKAGNTEEATKVYDQMHVLMADTFKEFDRIYAEVAKASEIYQKINVQKQ